MNKMDLSQRQRCTSLHERTPKASAGALPLPAGKGHQSLTRSHTLSSTTGTGNVTNFVPMPMKLSNKVIDRLKRDYNVSDIELTALRCIIRKVDLYDTDIRERWYDVLKSEVMPDKDTEAIAGKVLKDADIDSLKQKLFLSRKELDTYISFTKKMEREKRQSISEKEELETKIQWHERRMKRFEEENKSLKSERTSLCKQINDLRGKSTKESAAKKGEQIPSINKPEIEMSKQRLIYEADAFAQERSKLIKDRQRLDEEVRTVQIRCVSLLAQLKHSEGIVQDLKDEKEQLKEKLAQALKSSNDSNTVTQTESEIEKCQEELKEMEMKYDNLQNELRNVEENRIELDHENMALKDTVNVVQKANEDANQRVKDIDVRYRETLSELRAITLSSEAIEQQRNKTQQELDIASQSLAELQNEMECDQEVFKKFLEQLCMELKEKVGEEQFSHEKESANLQDQVEIMSKKVVAEINQARKMQENYENLISERDDLEQESRDLKYVLQQRMDVTNLKMAMPNLPCECSKEKAEMKEELEDCQNQIKGLDDEVNRLHQDKQQLLMSFLNLQASKSPPNRGCRSPSPASGPDDEDIDVGNEIRHYLSIIEELTEEKLRLENVVSDLDIEKQKLSDEVERLTEHE